MKKFLLSLFIFIVYSANCQTAKTFFTRYGSTGDDVGNCIIQSVDGTYIVLGQTSGYDAQQQDILLTRNDSLGRPIWQKRIGGPNIDIGKTVIELADSSLILIGNTTSYGNGGYDIVIYRTNRNGEVLWMKTYGGTDWEFASAGCKTMDGKLVICGTTFSYGRGGIDSFIIKLDYSGNFIWTKIFGGKEDDELKDIIATPDGGYMAAGYSKSYGDVLGDVWVAKFDAQGDSTWFFFKGGNKKDVGTCLILDKNGDYIIGGGSETYTNGKEDLYLFKMNSAKNVLWERNYGVTNEDEEANDILLASSTVGDFLVLYGTKEQSGLGLNLKNILLDANGVYLFGGSFGWFNDDIGYSMTPTKDRGYIACGYTESYDAQLKDVFIVKYDSLMFIGSQILSLSKNKVTAKNNAKVFPTLITDSKVTIEMPNAEKTEFQIFDSYGNALVPDNIETLEQDKVRITIPKNVEGNIIITSKTDAFVKKCIVQ